MKTSRSTLSGVLSGRLRRFDDVLWEWVALQDRAGRDMGWQDVPWWYGERTCLGLLAGAAWRSGAFALQEHYAEKRFLKHFKPGRGDLYVGHWGRQFVLEAKAAYVSLDRPQKQPELLRALKSARADAKGVRVFYKEAKLACVFVIPSTGSKQMESYENRIHQWVQGFQRVSDGAIAWVFPADARDMTGDDARLYPGIGVVLERVG